jgi:uncharacterized protein (TIGR02172 family)
MEPGGLIARGRTADVYAWETGKVLKLFHDWADRGMVEYEQRIAQAVHAAGVNTPAVGEIVTRNNRLGLVYDRVDAKILLDELIRRPWRAKQLARQMADLQASMHASRASGLPSMHARLRKRIQSAGPLPEQLRQKALAALEGLPDGQAVCHGDFHPENVLVTDQGLMAIDWVDATAGHPLGDFARSELLIVQGELPPNPIISILINLIRRTFFDAYVERYFSQSPYTYAQVGDWLPVVAAARLDEGIDSEEANLLRIARDGLNRIAKETG